MYMHGKANKLFGRLNLKVKEAKESWIWQHCKPIMKSNYLLSQTIMGRKVP
jgi:hypothetical protein